jgi:ABC-type dipeptide/oligopeptide/nickel transport system permease component
MIRYINERLVQMLLVLLVLTFTVFFLLHLSGNPATLLLPADATQAQIDEMSRSLGLDKPLLTQYRIYLGKLIQGDLGSSYRMNLPVVQVIWTFLPNTISLGVLSIAFATLASLVLGIAAAVKRDGPIDLFATFLATMGISMPTFWFAILLLLLFGVTLKWLPIAGLGGWKHYVLPVISLGWYSTALLTRVIRSSMLEVLGAEYIRVARSKGLNERRVIFNHALRNALLPVITIWGLQLGNVIMGSIVTETVFAWPGVGKLSVDSVLGRDYPVVLGLVLTYGALFALLNAAIDISYAFLDPRISYD